MGEAVKQLQLGNSRGFIETYTEAMREVDIKRLPPKIKYYFSKIYQHWYYSQGYHDKVYQSIVKTPLIETSVFAMSFFAEGKSKLAKESLKRIYKYRFEDPEIFLNLAAAHAEDGNFDESIKTLNTLQNLHNLKHYQRYHEQNPYTYFLCQEVIDEALADIYRRMKNYDKQIQYLEKALKTSSGPISQGVLHNNLASAYFMQGQTDKAKQEVLKAIALLEKYGSQSAVNSQLKLALSSARRCYKQILVEEKRKEQA